MTWLACLREQEGLWLLDQAQRIGAANNVAASLHIGGEPDGRALRAAVAAVIARHPGLRTEFATREGRLVRRIRPAGDRTPVTLECGTEAAALIRTPIDVLRRPPYRVALLSTEPGSHELLLVFHHCVCDGSSVEVVVRDLCELYAAAVGGRPASLPDADFDFAGHVAAEQAALGALEDRARAYWEPALAEFGDALRVPEHGTGSGRAESIDFVVDPGLAERLRGLARRHGASLFVVLLTCLQVVQHRYAGGGDDGVATAVAMDARPRGTDHVVGMFANEAPLITRIDDERSFLQTLELIERAARDLFKLRRYPFTEALARFGHAAGSPAMRAQVGVTYVRAGKPAIDMPDLTVTRSLLLANGGARRPILVWFFDEPDRVHGRLEYDEGAITAEVAGGIVRHFLGLARSAAADPDVRLRDIDLLAAEERSRVITTWNATDVARSPAATVHELVESQVVERPRAAALRFGGEVLTYATIDERANRLAHHLRRLGVTRDAPVGVCVGRCPDLVIALLAILKAGGAYLPLDPAHPPERLRRMLEDARAPVLVTRADIAARLPSLRATPVLLDRDASLIAMGPTSRPTAEARPDDLAYVIYTSGSTGAPKGVAMSHRAAVNLLAWQASAFTRSEPAVTCQFTSVTFDVAFQEIFSTLATGGCLVMIDEDVQRDPRRLAALIADAGIERLFVPFLALNALARHLEAVADRCGLLEVISAGEQLEITPAIRRLWARRPDWTLENQYGPTETHVVTAQRLRGRAGDWPRLPPIGRPIANARVYILDRHRNPVPVGVPGELYVGGAPLARGYVRRPDLTAKRFVPDPFAGPGSRLYRTGDLARWSADGAIEFLGRLDDQVKIRGVRVEPAEVQLTLARHPGVQDVAVVACDDASGTRRLVAYVVAAEGAAAAPGQLRAFAMAELPDHMVPTAFVLIDALPLTPHGKLDRQALPAADPALSLAASYVAPSSRTEARLATVWADVLGVARVGVDDDFFELGGHSLLAAEVVAKVSAELGRDVPLRLLFAGPTVGQLARLIEAAPATGRLDERIPRAPRRGLADRRGA